MASDRTMGPATPGELERLAQAYTAQAIGEEQLANALRHQGLAEAAARNTERCRLHRRTAEVLNTYARELDARSSAPVRTLMAAE